MHNNQATWYYVRTMNFTEMPEPYIQVLSYMKDQLNNKGIYDK